jgi:hypothetical protein
MAKNFALRMLNVALPLSARPINFWKNRSQEDNRMATTQRPVSPALKAMQAGFRAERHTPEKLIVSQRNSQLQRITMTANK